MSQYASSSQHPTIIPPAAYQRGSPMSDYSRTRGSQYGLGGVQGSNYGGAYRGQDFDSQPFVSQNPSFHGPMQRNPSYVDDIISPGAMGRSYSQPLGSRRGSIGGRMSPAPMLGNPSMANTMYPPMDMLPLEEHYDYQNYPSRHSTPIPSRRSRTLSAGHQYPSSYALERYNPATTSRVHVPYQSTYYDYDRDRRRRHHHRSGSYSGSSESDLSSRTSSSDSDSTYSGHYTSHGRDYYPAYRTAYQPTYGNQTVVQASRHQPMVVPINGGYGGYVIVPAAGQTVKVVASTNYLLTAFVCFVYKFKRTLNALTRIFLSWIVCCPRLHGVLGEGVEER